MQYYQEDLKSLLKTYQHASMLLRNSRALPPDRALGSLELASVLHLTAGKAMDMLPRELSEHPEYRHLYNVQQRLSTELSTELSTKLRRHM